MPSSYTASALIVLIIVSVTMASPTGAPTLACNWMRPLHIALPQTGQSPFITTPDKQVVEADGAITLVLVSTIADRPFKGFMVIAYDELTSRPVGSFDSPSTGQTKSCADGLQNMVTHTDNYPKSVVKVQWNAPPSFEGNVVFRTTFVENYSTFWVKTKSFPIAVLGSKTEG